VHARSTTFQGRPESIDAGIAYVRDEVQPLITQIDGCIGLSMMVNRETGRCIATSSWQSPEAMRASDKQLKSVRARGAEILGGTPEVQEWEIAVLHRDHRTSEGACARATWVRTDPSRIDETVESFRSIALPGLDELQGFCSASLLVNRETGLGVATTSWDGTKALQGSRESAGKIRSSTTKQAKADVLEVVEFELVLAHLRVPELV